MLFLSNAPGGPSWGCSSSFPQGCKWLILVSLRELMKKKRHYFQPLKYLLGQHSKKYRKTLTTPFPSGEDRTTPRLVPVRGLIQFPVSIPAKYKYKACSRNFKLPLVSAAKYYPAQQAFSWGWGEEKDRGTGFSVFYPREKWCESQTQECEGGGGKGRKSFQTNPWILETAHLTFHDSVCRLRFNVVSVVRTLRTKYVRNNDLRERRNLDESERLMQALKLQFQKLNLIISKKIFSIRLKGRTQFKGEVLVLCPNGNYDSCSNA